MSLESAYQKHVAIRQKSYEDVISDLKLAGIVISSGAPTYYCEDDQSILFRPYHHFNHWVPATGPHHAVVIRPGSKPKLLYFLPQDFWHENKPLGSEFWLNCFEVQVHANVDDLWKELGTYAGLTYLGPDESAAVKANLQVANELLKNRLNWHRAYKSEYELMCLDLATEKAAKGHMAAYERFMEGGSELQIHHAYLHAMSQIDAQLPYSGIVALNEKAAVLHYENKRTDVRDGHVLLIDSGAKIHGYCSDITRTYAARGAPAEFVSLLNALNESQIEQCSRVAAGMNFGSLHHHSHLELAKILLNHGLIKGGDPESLVQEGLTRPFYPHGLGHMLGLFVHDVGGKQIDPQGSEAPKDEKHPTLRTLRVLEAGMVFTVEPGLYFIDFLLMPMRQNEFKERFNWPLIDRLMPFGGIRIEDDVVVTPEGIKNLTRQYLP